MFSSYTMSFQKRAWKIPLTCLLYLFHILLSVWEGKKETKISTFTYLNILLENIFFSELTQCASKKDHLRNMKIPKFQNQKGFGILEFSCFASGPFCWHNVLTNTMRFIMCDFLLTRVFSFFPSPVIIFWQS